MVVPGSEVRDMLTGTGVPKIKGEESGRSDSERTLAHPAQHPLRREDHILPNDGILLYDPVDPRHERGGCSLLLKDARAYEDGPDRRELVKRLCVEELATGLLGELEEAARKVIANCVP